MSHYAIKDQAGRVLRVVASDQLPDGGVLLLGFTGWPAAPFHGAVLQVLDGELFWHDPRPLPAVKAARWEALKTVRQALDEAPIGLRDFQLDADWQSRFDVMGALLDMQLTGQTSRAWRCADNVMRELSFEDIKTVGTGIAARRQLLIETSDSLYQQIQAASTAAEVQAIVWPSDPP